MQPKIRWRKSDEQELKRVVKNFNAKLSRIEKKNPKNSNYLPQFWDKDKEEFTKRLSVKQMKDLIQTRKDFNQEINALRKFSERGQEEIVSIPGENKYNTYTTIWQKEQMESRIKDVNRKRKRRLKEILNTPIKDKGEDTGTTHGQARMGNTNVHAVTPMNAFTNSMTQHDLKWKFRAILNESQHDYFGRRDEQLRENYIHGIKIHYDYEGVKDVIEEIEKMPIKKFLEIFYANDITLEYASPVGLIKAGKLDNMKPSEFDKNGIDYEYQMVLYNGYETALKNIWLPKNEVKEKQPKKRTAKKKKK